MKTIKKFSVLLLVVTASFSSFAQGNASDVNAGAISDAIAGGVAEAAASNLAGALGDGIAGGMAGGITGGGFDGQGGVAAPSSGEATGGDASGSTGGGVSGPSGTYTTPGGSTVTPGSAPGTRVITSSEGTFYQGKPVTTADGKIQVEEINVATGKKRIKTYANQEAYKNDQPSSVEDVK